MLHYMTELPIDRKKFRRGALYNHFIRKYEITDNNGNMVRVPGFIRPVVEKLHRAGYRPMVCDRGPSWNFIMSRDAIVVWANGSTNKLIMVPKTANKSILKRSSKTPVWWIKENN